MRIGGTLFITWAWGGGAQRGRSGGRGAYLMERQQYQQKSQAALRPACCCSLFDEYMASSIVMCHTWPVRLGVEHGPMI